jgi:Leucine-rich repeat (LRR) protein
LDLSIEQKEETFTFNCSNEEKLKTSAICFVCCDIDFIPLEIFQEFPNLKLLFIRLSNLPIIKANLFTEEFIKIECLYLKDNNIQEIEEDAFSELKELKLIDLSGNEIESIRHDIFKNNLKLEMIDFTFNDIKLLNVDLFKNLVNLKELSINYSDYKIDNNTMVNLHEDL